MPHWGLAEAVDDSPAAEDHDAAWEGVPFFPSATAHATAGADGGRVGGLFDALPGRFYS